MKSSDNPKLVKSSDIDNKDSVIASCPLKPLSINIQFFEIMMYLNFLNYIFHYTTILPILYNKIL